MDIWTKQKRSEVMSKIRGKNTKPEMLLRSRLFKEGFRFRVHKKDMPGKPDIVLPKYKTAIFVHGCFWHYHNGCNEGRIPSSNSEFWREKLLKNILKDSNHVRLLTRLGWKVLVVWECEIERHIDRTINNLIYNIKN